MKRLSRKTMFCLLVVSGLLGYGALGAHTMADTGTGVRSTELCAPAHQGDPVQQAALSTARPGDQAFDGEPARQPLVVAQATDFNELVADGRSRLSGAHLSGATAAL